MVYLRGIVPNPGIHVMELLYIRLACHGGAEHHVEILYRGTLTIYRV